MDRVRSGNHFPRRHYVPYFYSNRSGHARFNRSNGLKNSSNHPRRFFRVDGQRYGANPADALEEWYGTDSADALEERNGTDSADTLERDGSDSTNALVS